ncbi:hypothetical protein [Nocardiopsis sp. CC223A]|uniref:hypothetical protein n=1 Tax=Nocardiopsis sp. CC223A TaxID=3044051 RepID=UPI0035567D2B
MLFYRAVLPLSRRTVGPGRPHHVHTPQGLADVVFCPFKGRGRPQWKKDTSSSHAKLRSPGEHGIAQLKQWDILRRLRRCPQRAGEIIRAVLVLQLRKAG